MPYQRASLPLADRLAGEAYACAYRMRTFPACGACPARGQATEALMERHLALRRAALPEIVRVLLIAESPPWSAEGAAVRHFYNPAAPHPDNLFRATAAALLGEERSSWPAVGKSAALRALAARGFLLLDSAKCPVNHLAPRERRAAIRGCTGHVLAEELDHITLAPGAVICMVVRSTVPEAVRPVLAARGMERYLVEPEGLPFPGRWSDHRRRFITSLRTVAVGAPMP
jgi:hypothetical protein